MSSDQKPDFITEPEPVAKPPLLNRRTVLAGGAVVTAGAAATGWALRRPAPLPRTADGRRKVRLAWNASALCLSPVLLAKELGIFDRNGLDVELINFAGSTDQLLEIISTGKAEAGVGMILRWIKPLEQGFDVRLIAGTHGGCIRVVGSRRLGITADPRSLRGKTIGLSEINGASQNALAVLLRANGVDPNREVAWRAYPSPVLPTAVDKGEIQAFADSDPLLYLLQKQSGGDLVEVLTNLSHPWEKRFCCALGVGGDIIRRDRPTATALAVSLLAAADICTRQPETLARAFAPYAKASEEDLLAILRMQTHDQHPIGDELIRQVALYATELRDIGVIRQETDPDRFARHITDNVFV